MKNFIFCTLAEIGMNLLHSAAVGQTAVFEMCPVLFHSAHVSSSKPSKLLITCKMQSFTMSVHVRTYQTEQVDIQMLQLECDVGRKLIPGSHAESFHAVVSAQWGTLKGFRDRSRCGETDGAVTGHLEGNNADANV